MNEIKEELLEMFEDVEFIPDKDDQLVGYAEMFGNDCIPLYKGINYIPSDSFEEAVFKLRIINPKARTADGFDKCLIGHLKLDSGKIIYLYDKEALIEQLKQEYREDNSGLFDGEEDIETSALEHYSFNIIGAYMD